MSGLLYLALKHMIEFAFSCNQIIGRTRFDQPALLEHIHYVSLPRRRQTVTYRNDRLIFFVQELLENPRLGERIDSTGWLIKDNDRAITVKASCQR